jgi:hypothetical protein
MPSIAEDELLTTALEALRSARRKVVEASDALASMDETNDAASDLDDAIAGIDQAVTRADAALNAELDRAFSRERGGFNDEPPEKS